ncbi:IclR family transcriptional regulator [Jatrophihabitans cynanchi]|uniref:IclR family transcriptional regulator n=1 Tax=Jatrophihabitans cynanchi TaxID=2944128 RepID=A0ABY7K6V3_9ACTN|nr:IclR family transcriptional regulator [Jatrophihabitans sp. SB3-54]WAX58996.1 IclR family transcriptional regulator [Jatrophihabitans sp. SB3-54]
MVKSAERTLLVLELLSTASEPQTLREISVALDMPRASTYALLMTLVARGWLTQVNGRYALGVRCLQVSRAFINQDGMVAEARPVMQKLSELFDETIHLGRIDGAEVIYLHSLPSRHRLSAATAPGRRMPATVTALGKAILAERPIAEVQRVLPLEFVRYTANTIVSLDRLEEELAATRSRGYAIDNEESSIGLRCFAVAVGPDSPSAYAISCSVPTPRLSEERSNEIAKQLLEIRALLSPSGGGGRA